MGDELDKQGTPPSKGESREAHQRRLARGMGIVMIACGIAFSVNHLTSPGPKSLDGLFLIAGLMFGTGWYLLVFWRTGHDPKGYSKPLFGKGDTPAEPKGGDRGSTGT